MITYDDLKKMNDIRKEKFKTLLDNESNPEKKILLKNTYRFKFIKYNGYKNLRLENNIEHKNSYPTSFFIESLSDLLHFYDASRNFFISNFSVLDEYLDLLQKYKLDQNFLNNFMQVLSSTKGINLFKIERVNDIKAVLAKFILKGSIINNQENNIYFIKDNNNNYYLISEYILVINSLKLCNCDIKTIMFSDIEFFNSNTFNRMFSDCSNLEKVVFNNLYLTRIETMSYMFSSCLKLKYVDFGNIDTSNIEFFDNMFFNCISLEYLDLNNLNVSKATYFNYMFANCINLVDLKINNWVLNKNESLHLVSMFENCIKLKNCNITSIDSIINNNNYTQNWNKGCPLFE